MGRCWRRRAGTRPCACGRLQHSLTRSHACCGAMTAAVEGVAFSPDGQMLATSERGPDRAPVAAQHSLTAEPRVLRGHDGQGVRAWRSVPMGRCWRRASADQTVQPVVAAAQPTAEPRVLRGHTGRRCEGVAFSPDGQMLATASADKTVRLWSLQHSLTAEPRVLQGHERRGAWRSVQSRWADAWRRASADQTVRLWSIAIDDSGAERLSRGEWQLQLRKTGSAFWATNPTVKLAQSRPLHPSFLADYVEDRSRTVMLTGPRRNSRTALRAGERCRT